MAPTRTFSDLERHLTPEAVRQYILALERAISDADALAQRDKIDIRRFGHIMGARLRELVRFAHVPPDPQQWEFFYTNLLFTLSLWEPDQTDAGKLARRIVRQLDSLWTFLEKDSGKSAGSPPQRSNRPNPRHHHPQGRP